MNDINKYRNMIRIAQELDKEKCYAESDAITQQLVKTAAAGATDWFPAGTAQRGFYQIFGHARRLVEQWSPMIQAKITQNANNPALLKQMADSFAQYQKEINFRLDLIDRRISTPGFKPKVQMSKVSHKDPNGEGIIAQLNYLINDRLPKMDINSNNGPVFLRDFNADKEIITTELDGIQEAFNSVNVTSATEYTPASTAEGTSEGAGNNATTAISDADINTIVSMWLGNKLKQPDILVIPGITNDIKAKGGGDMEIAKAVNAYRQRVLEIVPKTNMGLRKQMMEYPAPEPAAPDSATTPGTFFNGRVTYAPEALANREEINNIVNAAIKRTMKEGQPTYERIVQLIKGIANMRNRSDLIQYCIERYDERPGKGHDGLPDAAVAPSATAAPPTTPTAPTATAKPGPLGNMSGIPMS